MTERNRLKILVHIFSKMGNRFLKESYKLGSKSKLDYE
jgi:hypothetical protein